MRHMVPSQALHDPPQSTPVSSPFCTPSVQLAHVPLSQVSFMPQSPSTRHSTHCPAALQTPPVHASPSAFGWCSGVVPLQAEVVHSSPSSGGTSFGAATVSSPPFPSHWTSLQSPGDCIDRAVPLEALVDEHEPLLQS